jgi:ATP-binding cassette, subfamily B, bacterial PglK
LYKLLKKSFLFFDSTDKKSLTILLFLYVLVGLIEIFGIASIVPFVGLLTDPEYFNNNEYVMVFKNYFSLQSNELLMVSGFILIGIFVLSNILNALVLWKTLEFGTNHSYKTSLIILEKYLKQPYKFFVNADISSLKKNILDESIRLAESIFLPMLHILSRVILLTFISILLISVNTQAFIYSLLIIGIMYLLIFVVIKNMLKKYGDIRLSANDKRFKTVNDCLNSIKDIKFYNAEKKYLTSYSQSSNIFLWLTAKKTLISTLPRYFIEIIAFGGFFSIILYLTYGSNDISTSLPTIALFILAAYRILPSMQQIFAYSSSIKFHIPALDLISKVIKLSDNASTGIEPIDSREEVIIFDNVSFSYDSNKTILNNVSFKLNNPGITAIIGSTGAGKTTLIDLLLGLYKPTTGLIKIRKLLSAHSLDKEISYVPQNISFVDDSIINNIAFGIDESLIDNGRVTDSLKAVKLDHHISTLPDGLLSEIGENGVKFSGGQLQRLGIARALYFNPQILVLDEATNALDIKTEEEILLSLKNNNPNLIIILITHRTSALKLSDNILHLSKGSLKMMDINNKDLSIEKLLKDTVYNN